MKKLLLSAVAVLFGSVAVFAQGTNPFTPASGALPIFTAGVAYSQVIQLSVPTTVTIDPASFNLPPLPGGISIPPFDATVDTVRFLVENLPSGLTAEFDNVTGIYLGNTTGSVTISGTLASAGSFTGITISSLTSGSGTVAVPGFGGIPVSFPGTLTIPLAGTFDLPRAPQALDGGPYSLSSVSSVQELNLSAFDVIQNVPNPFNTTSNIKFSVPTPGSVSFKVFDVIGKQVFDKTINAESGVNVIKLNATDFNAGAYFYTVTNGDKSFTKRMIVSGK